MQSYQISRGEVSDELAALRSECRATLTSPPDGMWEAFRAQAQPWIIRQQDQAVGFALVDEAQQLLQFYVQPPHLPAHLNLFAQLLEETKVKSGIVGTHQPIYLSTALHFVQYLQVHTYLFRELVAQVVDERKGELLEATPANLKQLVDFCHYSVGAPPEWLNTYLGGLISRQELFYLLLNDTIVGTCEVRKNSSVPTYADIGMIVSPDFRRQGYGTHLLGQAKRIAQQRSLIPICSCETGNHGSLRAIHANGFRSAHQLLSVSFSGQVVSAIH